VKHMMAIFDRFLDLLAILAIIIIIFLMFFVVTHVVMRYAFSNPIAGVTTIGEVSLLYLTFIGTAWVLRREGHVKLEIIISRFSPRNQSLIHGITSILAALLMLVIIYYSALVTWDHFQRGTYLIRALEFPTWSVIMVIPIGMFLLFIQFIRRADGYLRSWKALKSEERDS